MKRTSLIAFTFSFFFFHSSLWAQEFLGDILSPAAPTWSVRSGSEHSEPANQQKFLVSAPISTNATDPASLNWRWSQLNLEKNLKLDDGSPIPDRFYNSEYSLSYKHNKSDTEFLGFLSSVGTSGDRTDDSDTKTVYNFTGFYSESKDPTRRWLWLLNYSNNRSFLNEIPIPGVAYIYRPSPDFFGVFGFPFLFIRQKINENWNSSIFLGPYVYRVEFGRILWPMGQVYGAADQGLQAYYRNNRPNKEDRLFYSESRVLVGIKSPLSKIFFGDLYGGLAYKRTAVEREDFIGQTSYDVHLDQKWFIGAQLSARF